MTDTLARWYAYAESHNPAGLDALIAADAVFQSPAVHRPLEGKAITVKYLSAAMTVLGNDSFRYTGEWRAERSAVLAFACTVDGLEVEGVDMIWWNEAGLIERFKVMVRPLRALNKVVERMGATLAA